MSAQIITLDDGNQVIVMDGVRIPVVSQDNISLGRIWAANTLNYWDEDGRFVIASNTPEHRAKKREWERRTWPDGIPEWEGEHGES